MSSRKNRAPKIDKSKSEKRRKREERDSVDSEVELSDNPQESESGSEEEETADQKRIRLAKEYLKMVAESKDEDSDEFERTGVEEREEVIQQRLEEEALRTSGKLFKSTASKVDINSLATQPITVRRGHKVIHDLFIF